jgi:hypothetical protein
MYRRYSRSPGGSKLALLSSQNSELRPCQLRLSYLRRISWLRVVMIANVLMLVMFYFLLVVPILWCLRPAKVSRL